MEIKTKALQVTMTESPAEPPFSVQVPLGGPRSQHVGGCQAPDPCSAIAVSPGPWHWDILFLV